MQRRRKDVEDQGRRKRGRLQRRIMDVVEEDMQAVGDTKEDPRDRVGWSS